MLIVIDFDFDTMEEAQDFIKFMHDDDVWQSLDDLQEAFREWVYDATDQEVGRHKVNFVEPTEQYTQVTQAGDK